MVTDIQLTAPSTLTRSKGFNIKLLTAVNEVGKFVRQLLAMYPIDEDSASYMRQTMFEKVESRIAFLQEVSLFVTRPRANLTLNRSVANVDD